jgi:hypothetical protein
MMRLSSIASTQQSYHDGPLHKDFAAALFIKSRSASFRVSERDSACVKYMLVQFPMHNLIGSNVHHEPKLP